MTGISFKSESGDDYLEISNNESARAFIERLAKSYGDEWYHVHVVCITSTDYSHKFLLDLISKSKAKYK